MPNSGEVEPAQISNGIDSQVRVFGVPPPDQAAPSEIVEGFLEAMTSDDPQLDTARQYLTPQAAELWRPASGITVLSTAPNSRQVHASDKEATDPRFQLTGKRVARVDERSAYQPETGTGRYEEYLQLKQVGGEWRIDSPPDGLVLAESDFLRIYRSANKYYFASRGLVADPVYVRQRIDPKTRMDAMTQTVKSLLDGPSKWLGPVVTSSFPTGTALAEDTRTLAYDGQGTLKVPLNAKASNVAQTQCEKMATQLLFTVRELTSSPVGRVELLRGDEDNSSLCAISDGQAELRAGRGAATAHFQYFVDNEKHLVRMRAEPDSQERPDPAEQVPGPLHSAGLKLSAAAIARDEKRAAAVTSDHSQLYVTSLTTDGPLPKATLTSAAMELSAPSWDGQGDLWVADRDPAAPVLWRVPGGTGAPTEVDVAGLDGRIEALRVSADGVRIALLISKDGRNTLHIGRVERPEGKNDAARVSVRELRPAAPQMEDVTAMSWAGRGRLLVVGREQGGVVQARYMQADGSVTAAASLPGATSVTAIAASEDERLPVVAYSEEDGIVWLPAGAHWKTVEVGGSAPVYPG
ncbi:LpqB family beta-propeller domain-containing protein [Streptomyces sp. NPDC006879]|uniref:LpqB family beta-propeller domain-containing protein n=1 Tax=Streptomyces sp. NPDC006879 TaxID=3364767 RepID=UPI00368F3AD6